MLYDAPGTWRLLQAMILLLGACHGEKNKDNKKTSKVVKSLQLIGCSYCRRSLSTYCTRSYQFLPCCQEGTATNKSATMEWSVSVLQQQDLYSCSQICRAVGGQEQGSTSTTLVTKASWIIIQRWYYTGPSLDYARDASLDTKEVTKHHPEQKGKTNAMNYTLAFFLFSLFIFFFFRGTSKTDSMNKGIQVSKSPHTLFPEKVGVLG
jgi:hypothetical protein